MYIRIQVQAGAKKETVTQVSDTEFRITVREKAKMNAANKRIIEIAKVQIFPESSRVRIISGHHSPIKLLSVEHKGDK